MDLRSLAHGGGAESRRQAAATADANAQAVEVMQQEAALEDQVISTASAAASASAAAASIPAPTTVARRKPKCDGKAAKLFALQLDVNDIKMEIARLHEHRQMLFARQLHANDGDAEGNVSFRAFKTFFDAFCYEPERAEATETFRRTTAINIRVSNRTRYPNERFPTAYVGQVILEQRWKMHFARYHDMRLELQRAQVGPITPRSVSIDCTIAVHATITIETLRSIFPHILAYEEIVRKLVGRRVMSQMQLSALLDRETHEIVQLDMTIDTFSKFTQVLQSPPELMLLFSSAA